MAALTSSGARKASEIVMLIFRVAQLSRPAMLSVVAAGQLGTPPRAYARASLKSDG